MLKLNGCVISAELARNWQHGEVCRVRIALLRQKMFYFAQCT